MTNRLDEMVERAIARYLELEPGEEDCGVSVECKETCDFMRELFTSAGVPSLLEEVEQASACNRGLVRLNEATLARAETAEAALLAKSAQHDELVARLEGAPVVAIEYCEIDGKEFQAAFDDERRFDVGARVRLVLEDSDAT